LAGDESAGVLNPPSVMRRAAPKHVAAALILAGGRSTRFWPEGRAARPKPLFALDGKTSLLADTIARVRPLIPVENIFVLVGAAHASAFRRVLKGLIPLRNLIVEPEGRGTTVAIAYGFAMIAERLGADTIVAAMPADHYIPQAGPFRRTIGQALRLAAQPFFKGLRSPRSGVALLSQHPPCSLRPTSSLTHGAVVVVGVTPTRPETGYGYQALGPPVGAGFRITRFVEKPDLAKARRMVRSRKFLWNGGIYVMSVATLTAELTRHAPALAATMERFGAMAPAALRAAYRRFEVDSFDRVVAEKSRNLISVRARFRWDDVGSWEGLWEAIRGGADSVAAGNVVMLDSHGVLVRGGKRLMVVLGMTDLVAVDTDDAILIARRSRSQDLVRVLEELRRRGMQKYL
jgi:mannose-1-phosphate guanylyltransferase